MKKSARYLRWLLILLAMIIVLQDRMPAFGKEARTVRVGFFSCNGFQDVGMDGSLSGYSYDYLEAVSQYMGWKMEYVTGYTLEECMELLKEGKIDLINGVYKTEARQEYYSYPEVNVGTSTSCLIISPDNQKIRYGDYASMNHATVGLLRGSAANDDFLSFSKEKGINFNVVYYDSANDVYAKIDRKEIDMALISSIQRSEEYRVIAKFAPHTFYVITNKSDTGLMDELNRGMSSLKICQPEFENMLEHRYYLNKDGIQPGLTDEELAYIKENPVIQVFCDPNWYPIERFNPKTDTYEGIAADLFREISKSTGLKFNFVKSANFTEAVNKMKKEEDGLLSGLTFRYQWGNEHQVSLTQPYISVGFMMIQKRNGEGTTIALPKGYYITKYITEKYPNYHFLYYDTVEECIDAVRNGVATTTYANSYETEYFLNMPQNRILKSRAIYSVRQEVSIGVSKKADPRLFSIISKGLDGISDTEFLEMVRAHSVMSDDVGLLDIMYANPLQFVLIWVGFLILMFVLFFLLFRARTRTKENQMLKIASEAKSDFLSRMSHDMRTPMNVILGMSAYSLEIKPKKEELLEYMEKIRISGEYLLTLINDTLDMSKIEKHKMELNYEPIRIPEILLILESVIGAKADEKKIHFQVDLEIEEQEYYKMDKLRLQQVLLNILSNSVKYTPSGGFVELKIQEIKRSQDSVTHQFMIRDNGEGMSDEFQSKVFQPFEQEKNKKIVGETGTGLGLAICKKLVEMMGGTITFQSKKNQGTTFFVIIESSLASIREMKRNKKQVIHEIGDVLSGKRVLVVEDQPMNAQIMSMILKKAGMIVEFAENGQEAVEAYSGHASFYYDVILMDVRMPVMDGLMATEKIREIVREDAKVIPIIAMTANAFESDIKMCIQAGMNAHLSKPIEPQRLFQVLSGWVKQTHKDPWPDSDDPENENEVTETIDE